MKTRSAFALAKQSPLMWVAILLAAGGSLALAIGGVMLWEQWSDRAHGRLAEGIILSKESRTLRGRTRNYYVRYRYTTEDGNVVDDESRVSRDLWQQLEQGRSVRIQYLASWRTSRLAGQSESYLPLLITVPGALVAIAGFTLGFKGIRGCVKQVRANQRGYATEATVTEVVESPLSVNRVQEWVISYVYRDHEGQEHSGRSPDLTPEEASTWKVGDVARIRYDFNRPEDSSWMGREDLTQEMSA
jgi:hypothetical protein